VGAQNEAISLARAPVRSCKGPPFQISGELYRDYSSTGRNCVACVLKFGMHPIIRQAVPADLASIERIVNDAYARYIPRIGKAPAPMNDNYQGRVAEGVVWVLTVQGEIAGLTVLLPKADHLLLDNVAVTPERQGSGLGRRLVTFAEAEALRLGYTEIRLYTNIAMQENLAIYTKLGYQESGRADEDGFKRVFMKKRLVELDNSR
jgi:GNAT superfamily N-acetyltransferase